MLIKYYTVETFTMEFEAYNFKNTFVLRTFFRLYCID